MLAYTSHLVSVLSVYIILAASLNLLAGYGGMLAASHIALFGVGAYATGFLLVSAQWSLWAAGGTAVLLSGGLSVIVGSVCSRFEEDYFFLATLAVHLAFGAVANNWLVVTGGPFGISRIPAPAFFGWSVSTPSSVALYSAAAATIVLALLGLILRSPFTMVLEAARDDALAAATCRQDVLRLRAKAFALAGVFAGFAGALYASTAGYIDPQAFSLDEVLFIIAIVVVGGSGDSRGPLVGAAILFVVPEALRFLPLPAAFSANIRQILFGLILVGIMMYRPSGVLGRYGYER